MKYENGIQKDKAEKRSRVIEYLHNIQDKHPQQYLTEEALKECAIKFSLTMAEIYGIAGYYTMFSFKPRGKYIIRLCKSSVCHIMGANNIGSKLENICNTRFGSTSADGLFTLEHAECLGQCEKAPSMMINKEVYGNLNTEKLENIIANLKNEKP